MDPAGRQRCKAILPNHACKSHATSQQREQIRTIEDIDLIVDTDAHLREGPDEIVPYLDEPWSELYGTTDDPKRDTL